MPRPKQETVPTRSLRKGKTTKTREFSEVHIAAMTALLLAALTEDVSFYVSKSTGTGMKKFRFYLEDENIEDNFSPYEDPEEVLQLFGEEVFGSQVTRHMLKHLAAARASEAPGEPEEAPAISKVTKRDMKP